MARSLVANPIKRISEVVRVIDFTDNLDDSGFKDLSKSLPAGAILLGYELDVTSGFAGDTGAVALIGKSGTGNQNFFGGTADKADTRWARAEYDFAIDGGAVGTINLRGDSLPSGAVVIDALLRVETVFTSGGAATLGIGSEAASDIQAATVVSGAPWSTAGAKRATLTATSAPILTTAARQLTATIAAAALTAGKGKFLVSYQMALATPPSAFAVAKFYRPAAHRDSSLDAATAARVTIRSATDFTLVKTNGSGKMRVTLFYLDGKMKPI